MEGYYGVLSSYPYGLAGLLATTVFTKRLVCHITNHQVVNDTSLAIIHNSHKSSYFFVNNVFFCFSFCFPFSFLCLFVFLLCLFVCLFHGLFFLVGGGGIVRHSSTAEVLDDCCSMGARL